EPPAGAAAGESRPIIPAVTATCTRRELLAYTARWGLAGLLGCGPARVLRAFPLGGPVGIQLYAVKDALRAQPAATLRAIRAIGFREVETAGLGASTAQQFRRLLDDADLRCPSAHLQFDSSNLGVAFAQAHAFGAHYATSGSLRATLRS